MESSCDAIFSTGAWRLATRRGDRAGKPRDVPAQVADSQAPSDTPQLAL